MPVDDYTDEVIRRLFGLAERLLGLLERWEVAGVEQVEQAEPDGLVDAVAGYAVTFTGEMELEHDPELPELGDPSEEEE